MLDSIPAPAGEMTAVLAPGMGGVLFHEAVGHPLESDAVERRRASTAAASARRWRRRSSTASTMRRPQRLGLVRLRRRGHARRSARSCSTDGVLQGWLYDRLRAEQDGVESTGNGRRQSYAHPPIPRMTNTYILNGTSTPEELVADTERGVFVTALGGGQTNPATGDFVFGCSEAYLIESGALTTPVRGANLIGRAIEVMSKVDAARRRLRHLGGHLRQGRPERPGRQRVADAADLADHGRRAPVPELADLCRAAVEAAADGESVEAYAEESRRTEVEARRGEVEGLTFAESRGVGVRVIAEGRLGFAYAADPSPDEVRETRRARPRERAARDARRAQRAARGAGLGADRRPVLRRTRRPCRPRTRSRSPSTSNASRPRAILA